ncbi:MULTISPECIES: hypothetical protein [Serratia]|uniref:hypothetical protein n=1 Tax=Serratia TaxID=613 RepID=UPI0027E56DC2|nr:hypothetical protein [Serratia marcescens]BEM07153.1 hypothetical protein SM14VA4_47250 [Serratia marcescens]
MEPQQEGITRALTPGEVNLARSVFGSTIFYQSVLVHCDSYLPFGLQNQYTAMSPNGELYFRRALYRPDFTVHHLAQHPRDGTCLAASKRHVGAYSWASQLGGELSISARSVAVA